MKTSLILLLVLLAGDIYDLPVLQPTEAELRLVDDNALAIMTIWQEARGESMEGKVAVGEVIRNRMAQRVHSDGTIPGTVLAPYQFSGFNTKDTNRIPSFKLDTENPQCGACQRAWEMSAGTNLTKGALYYYNPKAVRQLGYKDPEWATDDKYLVTIGNHQFYRG